MGEGNIEQMLKDMLTKLNKTVSEEQFAGLVEHYKDNPDMIINDYATKTGKNIDLKTRVGLKRNYQVPLSFKETLALGESRGEGLSFDTTNSESSAYGPFQVTETHHKERIKSLYGADWSTFQKDPKLQEKYMDVIEEDYNKALPSYKNYPIAKQRKLTDEQVKATIHVLGSGGAKTYLQTGEINADTPEESQRRKDNLDQILNYFVEERTNFGAPAGVADQYNLSGESQAPASQIDVTSLTVANEMLKKNTAKLKAMPKMSGEASVQRPTTSGHVVLFQTEELFKPVKDKKAELDGNILTQAADYLTDVGAGITGLFKYNTLGGGYTVSQNERKRQKELEYQKLNKDKKELFKTLPAEGIPAVSIEDAVELELVSPKVTNGLLGLPVIAPPSAEEAHRKGTLRIKEHTELLKGLVETRKETLSKEELSIIDNMNSLDPEFLKSYQMSDNMKSYVLAQKNLNDQIGLNEQTFSKFDPLVEESYKAILNARQNGDDTEAAFNSVVDKFSSENPADAAAIKTIKDKVGKIFGLAEISVGVPVLEQLQETAYGLVKTAGAFKDFAVDHFGALTRTFSTDSKFDKDLLRDLGTSETKNKIKDIIINNPNDASTSDLIEELVKVGDRTLVLKNGKVDKIRDKDGKQVYYPTKQDAQAVEQFGKNPEKYEKVKDVNFSAGWQQSLQIGTDMIPMIAAAAATGGGTVGMMLGSATVSFGDYYEQALAESGDISKAALYAAATSGGVGFLETRIGKAEALLVRAFTGAEKAAIIESIEQAAKKTASKGVMAARLEGGFMQKAKDIMISSQPILKETPLEVLQELTNPVAEGVTAALFDMPYEAPSEAEYINIMGLTTLVTTVMGGLGGVASANKENMNSLISLGVTNRDGFKEVSDAWVQSAKDRGLPEAEITRRQQEVDKKSKLIDTVGKYYDFIKEESADRKMSDEKKNSIMDLAQEKALLDYKADGSTSTIRKDKIAAEAAEVQKKLDKLVYSGTDIAEPIVDSDEDVKQKEEAAAQKKKDKEQKTQDNAIQEQKTTEVPVQSEATGSGTNTQGQSQPESQGTTQQSQTQEQVQGEEVISDSDYNTFVNDNVVPPTIIETIAQKVKQNETLSLREQAILAKVAEIEKRRQDSLSNINEITGGENKGKFNGPYFIQEGKFTNTYVSLQNTKEEVEKEINARYDAELAELEKQSKQSVGDTQTTEQGVPTTQGEKVAPTQPQGAQKANVLADFEVTTTKGTSAPRTYTKNSNGKWIAQTKKEDGTLSKGVPVSSANVVAQLDSESSKRAAESAVQTENQEVESFKTAKGSTYVVNQDGTTTRDKAARKEHPGQKGPQPKSTKTYYVTEDDLNKLSLVQATHPEDNAKFTIAELPDGKIAVGVVREGGENQLAANTTVEPKLKPAVGLYPVEIWEGYLQPHFGNEITEVISKNPAPIQKQAVGATQTTEQGSTTTATEKVAPTPTAGAQTANEQVFTYPNGRTTPAVKKDGKWFLPETGAKNEDGTYQGAFATKEQSQQLSEKFGLPFIADDAANPAAEPKKTTPKASKTDSEIKRVTDEIQFTEIKIEEFQEEIKNEKENLKVDTKEIRDKIAEVRASKMSKAAKEDRIEELKAEIEDLQDNYEGIVENYKNDIENERADLKKLKRELTKLQAVKQTEVATETTPAAAKTETPQEDRAPTKEEIEQAVQKVDSTSVNLLDEAINRAQKDLEAEIDPAQKEEIQQTINSLTKTRDKLSNSQTNKQTKDENKESSQSSRQGQRQDEKRGQGQENEVRGQGEKGNVTTNQQTAKNESKSNESNQDNKGQERQGEGQMDSTLAEEQGKGKGEEVDDVVEGAVKLSPKYQRYVSRALATPSIPQEFKDALLKNAPLKVPVTYAQVEAFAKAVVDQLETLDDYVKAAGELVQQFAETITKVDTDPTVLNRGAWEITALKMIEKRVADNYGPTEAAKLHQRLANVGSILGQSLRQYGINDPSVMYVQTFGRHSVTESPIYDADTFEGSDVTHRDVANSLLDLYESAMQDEKDKLKAKIAAEIKAQAQKDKAKDTSSKTDADPNPDAKKAKTDLVKRLSDKADFYLNRFNSRLGEFSSGFDIEAIIDYTLYAYYKTAGSVVKTKRILEKRFGKETVDTNWDTISNSENFKKATLDIAQEKLLAAIGNAGQANEFTGTETSNRTPAQMIIQSITRQLQKKDRGPVSKKTIEEVITQKSMDIDTVSNLRRDINGGLLNVEADKRAEVLAQVDDLLAVLVKGQLDAVATPWVKKTLIRQKIKESADNLGVTVDQLIDDIANRATITNSISEEFLSRTGMSVEDAAPYIKIIEDSIESEINQKVKAKAEKLIVDSYGKNIIKLEEVVKTLEGAYKFNQDNLTAKKAELSDAVRNKTKSIEELREMQKGVKELQAKAAESKKKLQTYKTRLASGQKDLKRKVSSKTFQRMPTVERVGFLIRNGGLSDETIFQAFAEVIGARNFTQADAETLRSLYERLDNSMFQIDKKEAKEAIAKFAFEIKSDIDKQIFVDILDSYAYGNMLGSIKSGDVALSSGYLTFIYQEIMSTGAQISKDIFSLITGRSSEFANIRLMLDSFSNMSNTNFSRAQFTRVALGKDGISLPEISLKGNESKGFNSRLEANMAHLDKMRSLRDRAKEQGNVKSSFMYNAIIGHAIVSRALIVADYVTTSTLLPYKLHRNLTAASIGELTVDGLIHPSYNEIRELVASKMKLDEVEAQLQSEGLSPRVMIKGESKRSNAYHKRKAQILYEFLQESDKISLIQAEHALRTICFTGKISGYSGYAVEKLNKFFNNLSSIGEDKKSGEKKLSVLIAASLAKLTTIPFPGVTFRVAQFVKNSTPFGVIQLKDKLNRDKSIMPFKFFDEYNFYNTYTGEIETVPATQFDKEIRWMMAMTPTIAAMGMFASMFDYDDEEDKVVLAEDTEWFFTTGYSPAMARKMGFTESTYEPYTAYKKNENGIFERKFPYRDMPFLWFLAAVGRLQEKLIFDQEESLPTGQTPETKVKDPLTSADAYLAAIRSVLAFSTQGSISSAGGALTAGTELVEGGNPDVFVLKKMAQGSLRQFIPFSALQAEADNYYSLLTQAARRKGVTAVGDVVDKMIMSKPFIENYEFDVLGEDVVQRPSGPPLTSFTTGVVERLGHAMKGDIELKYPNARKVLTRFMDIDKIKKLYFGNIGPESYKATTVWAPEDPQIHHDLSRDAADLKGQAIEEDYENLMSLPKMEFEKKLKKINDDANESIKIRYAIDKLSYMYDEGMLAEKIKSTKELNEFMVEQSIYIDPEGNIKDFDYLANYEK